MKKTLLFTMVIVLASLSAQAQMKVQSDGHISLGTLSGAWNVGTQVYPSGSVHFNHQSTEDWNGYQLLWDCQTNETITCQSDLDDFDYAVKKTISVTSSDNEPVVLSADKVTFRVTDSFEVTGPFEVLQGGGFTVYQQTCPESN